MIEGRERWGELIVKKTKLNMLPHPLKIKNKVIRTRDYYKDMFFVTQLE